MTAQPTARLPRKWTVAEDQKLREEVDAQIGEGEVKDWCKIASALPGRTNKDCRKRWHNSVAGGLKKGQWSKSEDLQLERGVQRFGQRWTLVSNTVQSRSADQCAKRWQQSLDPDLDRSEWKDSEDKVLIEAVQKLGRHWKDIQRHHVPGRSKNSIKNRYTVLLRRYQNQGIALPFSAITPEPTTPDIRQSTYSTTTDDDDDFGDNFLPSQPQVSTPEHQQSWPFDDESLTNWTSDHAFSMAAEAPTFPPTQQQQQQQLLHTSTAPNSNCAVENTPQWNWTTTSMTFPQITYQQPLPDQNTFMTSPHSLSLLNLAPGSPYSPVQTIIGPTNSTFMGTTGRRSFPGTPTGAPLRSSPRPLSAIEMPYQDPETMAGLVWGAQYGTQRESGYRYG